MQQRCTHWPLDLSNDGIHNPSSSLLIPLPKIPPHARRWKENRLSPSLSPAAPPLLQGGGQESLDHGAHRGRRMRTLRLTCLNFSPLCKKINLKNKLLIALDQKMTKTRQRETIWYAAT